MNSSTATFAVALVLSVGLSASAQSPSREIVKGQVTYEIDGKTFGSPEMACRAYLQTRGPKVSFSKIIPRTDTNVVQWECEYKEGDNVLTSGTASAVLKCPANSEPFDWAANRPTCECGSGFRASGGACSNTAQTPVAATGESQATESPAPPAKGAVRVNAGGEGERPGWVDLNPCDPASGSKKTAAQIRAANPSGSLVQAGLEDIAKHFAPGSVAELDSKMFPSTAVGKNGQAIAAGVKVVMQSKSKAAINTSSDAFTGLTKTIFEKEGWKVIGPRRAIYTKP